MKLLHRLNWSNVRAPVFYQIRSPGVCLQVMKIRVKQYSLFLQRLSQAITQVKVMLETRICAHNKQRVTLLQVVRRARKPLSLVKELPIKETQLMVKRRVMECRYGLMEVCTRDTGLTTRPMDLER